MTHDFKSHKAPDNVERKRCQRCGLYIDFDVLNNRLFSWSQNTEESFPSCEEFEAFKAITLVMES